MIDLRTAVDILHADEQDGRQVGSSNTTQVLPQDIPPLNTTLANGSWPILIPVTGSCLLCCDSPSPSPGGPRLDLGHLKVGVYTKRGGEFQMASTKVQKGLNHKGLNSLWENTF